MPVNFRDIFSPNAPRRRRRRAGEDAAAGVASQPSRPENTPDFVVPQPSRPQNTTVYPPAPAPTPPSARRAADAGNPAHPGVAFHTVINITRNQAPQGPEFGISGIDDMMELMSGFFEHMPPMMHEFVMPPAGLFGANVAPEMDEAGMAEMMRELEQAGEAENEHRFQRVFQAAHAGSVGAMKTLVDKLHGRDPASVPKGGITRDNIDDRDAEIYYKLPALLLTELLPQVCEGRGALRDVALFDYNWQKESANGSENCPSMLPQLYVALRYLHGNDKAMMKAALPALVTRLSHLVETGAEGSTANEKDLVTMLLDAAHHIDGHILSETLRKAHAHLDSSTD